MSETSRMDKAAGGDWSADSWRVVLDRVLTEGKALERENGALREALESISRQRNNRYESTVGIVCDMADKALAGEEVGP
jgi:hypothetical protein